jgi:hypothetical protein
MLEGITMLQIREYVKADSLEQAYELNQKRNNVIIGGMHWLKMMNKNISKFDRFDSSKKEASIKSVKDEKEASYMSSPISVNETQKVEDNNEESVSNLK